MTSLFTHNVNMTETETSYSLVQVIASTEWMQHLNFMSTTCNEVRRQQQQQQLYSLSRSKINIIKYIQFDRSTVQETLKISGNTVVFSLYTTVSSSMHCSVRHEVEEFRRCSRLRSYVSRLGLLRCSSVKHSSWPHDVSQITNVYSWSAVSLLSLGWQVASFSWQFIVELLLNTDMNSRLCLAG